MKPADWKPKLRHILVLAWTDQEVGRGIIRGAGLFAFPSRHWAFHLRHPLASEMPVIRRLKPDGIIAQVADEELAECLHRWRGGPVVNVSGVLRETRFPSVGFDNRAVGRMAAEYFANRGFRHFAYLGQRDRENSDEREAGFREALREREMDAASLTIKRPAGLNAVAQWDESDRELHPWLQKLPRPLALLAHNDIFAADALRVCSALGIAVPQEIAILGVGSDPIICRLGFPPLSSVALPCEEVGIRAAEMLAGLLEGKTPACDPELLQPQNVVTRQSSDVFAVDDPAVAAALRHIHLHADGPLDVAAVVLQSGVNRRTLERRFSALLRHSLAQEIVRVRLDRARDLLTATDLSLEKVAETVGFSSAVRLAEVFRRELNLSPGQYRRGARAAR
ncbi:MAG: substrate-binding domain-containing protein [Candidatus Competibacteraceae bacterium]|nr:substrate-binding domain-containing protein [Candidatus Competibacteraceae bacterium]